MMADSRAITGREAGAVDAAVAGPDTTTGAGALADVVAGLRAAGSAADGAGGTGVLRPGDVLTAPAVRVPARGVSGGADAGGITATTTRRPVSPTVGRPAPGATTAPARR